MNKIYYYIVGAFVLIGGAIAFYAFVCKNKGSKDIMKDDKIINGFSFNTLPSATEKNGYIFAINRNTKEFQFLTIIKVPEVESPVNLPSDSDATVSSAETLLNWLEDKRNNNTEGSAKMNEKIKIKLKFRQAIHSQVPLLDAQKSIDSLIENIRTKLNQVQVADNDFYMICETIKTKGLDYEFDKSIGADESFKTNVKHIAKTNSNIKIVDNEAFKIQYQDNLYRVVLYKKYPLQIKHSLTGEYEVKILPAP